MPGLRAVRSLGFGLANLNMRGKRTVRLSCGCCTAHDLRAVERERERLSQERLTNALIEAESAASIQCQSCTAVIEGDSTAPYCRNCKSYWDDVSDGLFSDQIYDWPDKGDPR